MKHFVSISLSISTLPHPHCGYSINEHGGNLVNNLKVNFKKYIYISAFDEDEGVDDCVLPLNLSILAEQEKKQILPYEVVNLDNEDKKKEVKIRTLVSSLTK